MEKFWENKKILITGAAGFFGMHLANYFSPINSSLFLLVRTSKSKEALSVFFPNNTILVGSITDMNYVARLFAENKFDFCFHLAAQSLVEVGGTNPLETFKTNIAGTWNVLEAARRSNTPKVVIASTAHVYGKNKVPLMESYFPRPSRPYETSKVCADVIAQTYSQYYKLPVAIARFVNTYGPYDGESRIVPRNIRLLMANKKPEIYSNYTSRDYLYIDDAVRAYVLLAKKIDSLKKKLKNLIFNFGTGRHYSNATIIKKIIQLSHSTVNPIIVEKSRGNEIARQYVSIRKAKRYLGWEPRYSLEEGLAETIKFYSKLT